MLTGLIGLMASPLASAVRVPLVQRTMIVTAYCPCQTCCGPNAKGITASGQPVTAHRGQFVAADRSIPFGTRISVPGYAGGRAVPVIDRGGAITGNKLDVFFPNHQAARAWGRKTLVVKIDRSHR